MPLCVIEKRNTTNIVQVRQIQLYHKMKNKMIINVKRFITSGLVAGVIIIIIGFGLVPIIGNQMNDVLKSLSLPPLSPAAMGFFAFVSMANGMAVTGLYILIESHFKSKMKAAFFASIVFWFFSYFLSGAALVAYGFMPFTLTAIGTGWGILEVVIAGIVSSKLYSRNK
jgi:hypothetical protein